MVWVITLYWYHWQRVTTVGISGSSRQVDNSTETHTLNQPLGETIMARYEINQTVNYSGIVEADSQKQAMDYFVNHAHIEFYESVEDEDITRLDEE